MKRIVVLVLAMVLVAGVVSACSININLGNPVSTQEAQTDAPADDTQAVQTDAPTEPVPQIGTLDDYVRVYKEVSRSYGDGNTNILRLPEIMINAQDVYDANDELVEKFGDALSGENTGLYALDYDAYLNDTILSVVTTAKYEGGNSYGLAYVFDVTTGDRLNNETLCSMTGREYNTVMSDLKDELTDFYTEKYATLPGNDSEKEKTLSKDNISAAVLYPAANGKLMAMCDIYAAIGGGHWNELLEVE